MVGFTVSDKHRRIRHMRLARDWDEEYILNLPLGEFDWFEAKGRKALDLTIPGVKEDAVRENLARAVSAFANSGGGTLIFGLGNPSSAIGRWVVDDGGVTTIIKGKTETREWLESIIPTLVEFPLNSFNVYAILPGDTTSQIQPGRALYVVDIPDSPAAPHQSAIDNRYYARVAGRSRPIGHRFVVDIMSRRQHPKIELEFEIKTRTVETTGRIIGGIEITPSPALANFGVEKPQKKITREYTLSVFARNVGKIYAQYVNCFIHLPVDIVAKDDLQVFMNDCIEEIDGRQYCRYYKENTIRDVVGFEGFTKRYGPSRFDPILPGLSHQWKIELRDKLTNLQDASLIIVWECHADNAPTTNGQIHIQGMPVVEAKEPEFDDEDD